MNPDLSRTLHELEKHASVRGWDQPGQLFALVPTEDLLAVDPNLDLGDAVYTAVQQEDIPEGVQVEQLLAELAWPPTVAGCAVIVEALVLPPEADAQVPNDPIQAAEFAGSHPDRSEARIVAGALRGGDHWACIRLRDHDEDDQVLHGDNVVPLLTELMHETLRLDLADGADHE